ncbi:MAG: polyketide cyclase [Chitinophagaceae bacterium]|nr:MAG: polyketide cyclase [Chitinophagaceae bacterium]
MPSNETKPLTVSTRVNLPVEKVWKYWSAPEDIKQWNNASDDWHTPAATNDLRVGGQFSSTMAARDGSMSFEFGGEYSRVEEHKVIEYALGDGRQVKILFEGDGDSTTVTETFDPEGTNPLEMQQAGWQAIINNFKRYAEAKG